MPAIAGVKTASTVQSMPGHPAPGSGDVFAGVLAAVGIPAPGTAAAAAPRLSEPEPSVATDRGSVTGTGPRGATSLTEPRPMRPGWLVYPRYAPATASTTSMRLIRSSKRSFG